MRKTQDYAFAYFFNFFFINIHSANQVPEIVTYFPDARLKFLNGGHNIGLVDSRDAFLTEVSQFINAI